MDQFFNILVLQIPFVLQWKGCKTVYYRLWLRKVKRVEVLMYGWVVTALHGCWVPLPDASESLGSFPACRQRWFRQSEMQPQRLVQDQGELAYVWLAIDSTKLVVAARLMRLRIALQKHTVHSVQCLMCHQSSVPYTKWTSLCTSFNLGTTFRIEESEVFELIDKWLWRLEFTFFC